MRNEPVMVFLKDLPSRDTFPIVDLQQVSDQLTHSSWVMIFHPIEGVVGRAISSALSSIIDIATCVIHVIDFLQVVVVTKTIGSTTLVALHRLLVMF